jgi:hypothetical protein
MITADEAIKIALAQNPAFNRYVEYIDGYAFCIHSEDEVVTDGGPDAPKVILKTTGEIVPLPDFILRYSTSADVLQIVDF